MSMSKYKFAPWLVFIAALLWAVDAPFRKYLTGDLSSTAIVLMEHLVISIVVLIFLRKYLVELKYLAWKEWLALIFIAFGGSALATVFFTQSFRYINPSVAILLQKIQPLFAITLAFIFLKERFTRWFWFWAVMGLFGAYLLTFPELKVSGLTLTGGTLGIVYALSAAFLWGGSTVFGRFVLNKISFQAMTAFRFLGALLFLFGLNIYYQTLNQIGSASTKDWLFVLIIAILAGFVSLFIYYKGLGNTRASIATIAELAFPFSAVFINWIFLDASLQLEQILGAVILFVAMAGLSMVNMKSIRQEILLEKN